MHLKSWAISRSAEQLHRFTTSVSPSRYLDRIYIDLLLAILMSAVYVYVFLTAVLGYPLDLLASDKHRSTSIESDLPLLQPIDSPDNDDNNASTLLNSSWILVMSVFNIISLPLKLFIAWQVRVIITQKHNLLYRGEQLLRSDLFQWNAYVSLIIFQVYLVGIVVAVINTLLGFYAAQSSKTASIINWLIGMLILRVVFYFGAAENNKKSGILYQYGKRIDLTTISLDEAAILHEVCPICMEDLIYLELSVSKLACGHIFHRICILKWVQRQQVCPLCKSALVDNARNAMH